MISIIIPFHEEHPFLLPAIQSALSQRCGPVELICVDDRAPRQTVARVASLLGDRPNTFVISCAGEGLSAARNTGIQAARGEYLMFVDSDDYLSTDALCHLSEIVRKREIDVVYFSAKARFETFHEFIRNPHYLLAYRRESLAPSILSGEVYFASQVLRGEWIPSACLQLVSREMVLERGIRFREGVLMEDHEFSVAVAIAARRITATRFPLYVRRVRRGSITTSSRSIARSEGYLVAMSAVRQLGLLHEGSAVLHRALGAYASNLKKLSLRERSKDHWSTARSARHAKKSILLSLANFIRPPLHSWLRLMRLSIHFSRRWLKRTYVGLPEGGVNGPQQ